MGVYLSNESFFFERGMVLTEEENVILLDANVYSNVYNVERKTKKEEKLL